MFKNVLFSGPLFCLSFYNGFSGVQPIPDLLYALYAINMTLFAQVGYAAFCQDVSFRKYGQSYEEEDKLPYRLSKMYVSSKKQIERFFSDYVYLTIYGFFVSYLEYCLWYNFEY